MDYYIWQNHRKSGQAMIYGGWPNETSLSMISGASIPAPTSPVVVTQSSSSQGQLTDNLLMTGPGRVFSHRLVQLLLDHGVENLEVFPCTVLNSVTGEARSDYRAVNVVGAFRCVIPSRSEFDGFDDASGRILAWDYLTLNETCAQGLKLFALAEMPVQLVVHRDVKAAIEAEGITGVEFVPQGKPTPMLGSL